MLKPYLQVSSDVQKLFHYFVCIYRTSLFLGLDSYLAMFMTLLHQLMVSYVLIEHDCLTNIARNKRGKIIDLKQLFI